MDCITPGLPVPHHLPEFAQVYVHWISDATQLFHPLLRLLPKYILTTLSQAPTPCTPLPRLSHHLSPEPLEWPPNQSVTLSHPLKSTSFARMTYSKWRSDPVNLLLKEGLTQIQYWYYVENRKLIWTYCIAQRTLLTALLWPEWEGSPKGREHMVDSLCCTV